MTFPELSETGLSEILLQKITFVVYSHSYNAFLVHQWEVFFTNSFYYIDHYLSNSGISLMICYN